MTRPPVGVAADRLGGAPRRASSARSATGCGSSGPTAGSAWSCWSSPSSTSASPGPTTAGVPLLAAEQGWGPGGIGWVLGGFGVGAVATAAVLAWRRPTVHAGVVAAVGLTLMAVGVLGIGVVGSLRLGSAHEVALAGAWGALAGVGTGLFGTLVNATLVAITPVQQLGRVMAAVRCRATSATRSLLRSPASPPRASAPRLPPLRRRAHHGRRGHHLGLAGDPYARLPRPDAAVLTSATTPPR